jgi:hypothetical protein
MSSSIAEKMLLFQRFGSQFDVPLEDLHLHTLGVPIFDPSCPSVCGHQCPDHADFPPETASNSPSPTNESVDNAHSDASPAYMEHGEEYVLCHLTRDQLRILWHQRLGHIHSRRVSKMHKHADGIPPVPIATELDTCPVCAHAKLRKAARGMESTRTRVTQPGQGIGVNFGFMVQKSKNLDHLERLSGLNGETCHCMIVDHCSGCLYGECFASKAPPLDFLNRWLLHHGLNDLCLGMLDPKSFMDTLQKKYNFKLKGTGPIDFHLGQSFSRNDDGEMEISAKRYVDKMRRSSSNHSLEPCSGQYQLEGLILRQL